MKLSNLAAVLRAAGVPVVETIGWSTRGYAGQDLDDVDGVLWHHTATNRNAFLGSYAPTVSLCINGRSDLPGPLCHIVLGRDGVAYLIAAGLANHAGRGSGAGIPTDSGNYHLIGIEMESSGITPWDWTDEQIAIAPVIGAALEKAYLQDQAPDLRLQMAHYEYSSEGKIDPAGWPGGMDGLRATINAALDGTTITEEQDEDMYVIASDSAAGDGKIWIGNGIVRRHIPDTGTLAAIQKMAGWGVLSIFKNGEVQNLPQSALGEDSTGKIVEIFNRVFGRDVQRWYNPVTGEVRFEKFDGAIPARSTDVHDTLSTNKFVAEQIGSVLAAFKEVPGVDAQLVERLGNQLEAKLEELTRDFKLTAAITVSAPEATTTVLGDIPEAAAK